MKRLIILLAFIAFTVTLSAQSAWDGFFQPVKVNKTLQKELNTPSPSTWLFRPAITISAMQLNWNKDIKGFDASAFESAGLGIGYQHYIANSEGLPYNNWGANLLLLFPLQVQETVPAYISVAATVDAFKFVNVGVGYNITLKLPFILTGIAYSF